MELNEFTKWLFIVPFGLVVYFLILYQIASIRKKD